MLLNLDYLARWELELYKSEVRLDTFTITINSDDYLMSDLFTILFYWESYNSLRVTRV